MRLLKLPNTLLHAQADACLSQWVAQLPPTDPQRVEVDASELMNFDSSALAVILACRRAVLARGAQLRVTGLPERAQALATVYGLSDLLH